MSTTEARPLDRALAALNNGPLQPYQLYSIMFPDGRFNTDTDYGSAGGGPSRSECAVNWYLGRYAKTLVRRESILNDKGRAVSFGAYRLTPEGRKYLREQPR